MDEIDETIKNLIDVALKGEHSEIQKIKNFDEYKVAKALRDGTLKVANGFAESARKLLKSYFKELKDHKDTAASYLIDYVRLSDCYNYYLTEYDNIKLAIVEYEGYMFSGHFIKSLFGCNREDE